MVGITLEICSSKIDRNHTPLCKSKLELAEQSTYAVVCCPLLICSSICLRLSLTEYSCVDPECFVREYLPALDLLFLVR